ncbi:hypothetical protein AB833_22840 [Chromatiales bacterium (ex Bugula neritina AB1)]|nr:hypothetical protein AB833_22840 [Chromatiales bacterium (ex Bugula neritina AB1)]
MEMVSVVYGGANGSVYKLEQSSQFMAVRTRSKRSLLSGPVPRQECEALQGFEMCFSIPEAGVEIFEKRTSSRSITVKKAKASLRNQADVRFAGSVLMDGNSSEPVIYTENIFVKFEDGIEQPQCRAVIAEVGLTVKRRIDYLHNAWFVAAPEGCGQVVFELAEKLLKYSGVEFCHPELVRRKGRRQIFNQQWHLKSTTVNGISISAGSQVDKAHETSRGAGTVIAVIDDGVDIDHPEFSGASKIIAPADFQFRSDNPRPKHSSDNHGTACAGVACANGSLGASGVAPEARLMPIRNVSSLGSQAEADAIAWAVDQGADVISCSWGPADGRWWDPSDPRHNTFAPLPDSTRLAIEHATQNGRQGKGCVIMWAAGNGNEDVGMDGYAINPNVFAVAACNDSGKRSIYSDWGDAIFCAFPSNDFGHGLFNHPDPLTPGIWTTDRRHGAGYNDGDLAKGDIEGQFTNSFGGTSSAAPGAAGVAALVLSINPDLHWQQVADVLRRSCDAIDTTNGNYQNGRSPLYGYGRINAQTAVQLAQPQQLTDSITITGMFMEPIVDMQTTNVSLAVADSRELVSAKVSVDLQHSWIGDLTVSLIPPGGDAIILHDREGSGKNDIKRSYDAGIIPELSALAGTPVTGDWKLEVTDHAFRDQGFIREFTLELVFEAVSRRKVSSKSESASAARKKPAKPKKPASARKAAGSRRKTRSRRKAG